MSRQKVLAFEVKPREPRALLLPDKLRFRFLRQRYEEREVAVTPRLALTGLIKPILCILAHCFQHLVAGCAALYAVGCDEGLLGRTREYVQNRRRGHLSA